MNVNKHKSGYIDTRGGCERPPCTGLTPDVLPEVPKPILAKNSQTGVFIRNALATTYLKIIKRKPKDVPHWYVLQAKYGRKKKAYEYSSGKHVEKFHERARVVKEPPIIPDYQIESHKIIYISETEVIIIVSSDVKKFNTKSEDTYHRRCVQRSHRK